MARNRSEKMPVPPEGWGEVCMEVARICAEELAEKYPEEYSRAIRAHGWRYSATPRGSRVRDALSSSQNRRWLDCGSHVRIDYVADLFLLAHAKRKARCHSDG